ncbi:unnamed protein product [Rotaria sp. Silwood2]|nr:unnamed protein product [Rotaria sp. Silwood2]
MAIFLRTKASADIKKMEKTDSIKITIMSAAGRKNGNDEQDDNHDCLKLSGSYSLISFAREKVEYFLEGLFEQEKQFPCQSWDVSKIVSQSLRTRLKELRDSDDCESIRWIKIYTAIERRETAPKVTISIVGLNEEAVDNVTEQCQDVVEGYVIWKLPADEYSVIVNALLVKKSPSIEEFRQQWKTDIRLDRNTNTITIPARSKMMTDNIKEALLTDKASSTLETNENDTSPAITVVVNSRGQAIAVEKGDITKVKNVDVIVNAANATLYHAGGVDKEIADAAGPALDQECGQIIAKNGGLPISAGKAVKTTAGNLPFKCVIHAIGPQYNDDDQQARPLLFSSVLFSLRLAECESYTSVALPAISSKTYGFPLEDCTNIVVRAVKQFFADYPQSHVKKVILLDMDDAACNSFAREVVIDHRNALIEDDDIINYELSPLTAKWCWQDDNGDKINDENHARQIEAASQHYLKTFCMPTWDSRISLIRLSPTGHLPMAKVHCNFANMPR